MQRARRLPAEGASRVETVADRCVCRRPTKAGAGSLRPSCVPTMVSTPGTALSDATSSGKRREAIQPWSSSAPGSRKSTEKEPAAGSDAGRGIRARSQPSTHSTGARNVSRPSGENVAMNPTGRTPSSTAAVPPSGVSTRSAWPRFCTGKPVLLADSTGLAGSPVNGPRGEGPRATLTAWPRSVPPSATSRYQRSPWRWTCGPSGAYNPEPDQSGRTGSSASPVPRSTATCWMPRPIAANVTSAVPSSSQTRSGSIPSTTPILVPSLHGPAGSSAVKTTHPCGANITVTITWNTPSRWRIVGAHTPPGVGTPRRSSCSGRVMTLPTCSQSTRSALR